MYHNGEISRTANYRYFILIEEKKKPNYKRISAKSSKPTDEIREYAKLRDEGIISEDDFKKRKKNYLAYSTNH